MLFARLFMLGSFSFRALFVGLLVVCALGGASSRAFANDGGLSLGGTPRLLSGHPSVTMTSEVINIDVYRNTVDCRFVFTNTGPACTVRMGFPDEGYGSSDPDEEEDSESIKTKPPHTTFTSFHSYVDGKKVATKLIRGVEEGHYWHTKLVRFPARSVRRIRDVYTPGFSASLFSLGDGKHDDVGRQGYMQRVAYILHTGSSWHGSIGRSEINVTFRGRQFARGLLLMPLREVAKDAFASDLRVKSITLNAVVWKGPCAPQVQGRTLHFLRTNWKPGTKDDLELSFGYRVMKPH